MVAAEDFTSESAKEAYDLALKQISAVADRSDDTLYITGWGSGLRNLDRLPPELATLTHLKSISLIATAVSDISIIANLDALETLSLYASPVSDLTPIGELKLKGLTVTQTKVRDLSVVARLQSLEGLDISSLPSLDIRPLTSLSALTALTMTGTPITDWSVICGLRKLATLLISNTGLNAIDGISQLEELTTLDLSENPISDLGPVVGLKKLASLDISGTKVTDLSPVASLVSLVSEVETANDELLSALSRGEKDAGERMDSLQYFQGLNFVRLPFSDGALRDLSELANPKRTRAAINHVRKAQGLEPIGHWRKDEAFDGTTDVAPGIPPQSAQAPRFAISDDGRIDLASPARASADAAALRQELVEKATTLASACPAAANDRGHIARPVSRYSSVLGDPMTPPAAAWSAGNTLRRVLAADQRRRLVSEEERDLPLLPEGIAESLTDLVETHNVWCGLDSELRAFDANRPSPAERVEAQEALRKNGQALARAAADTPQLFTERASAVALDAVEAAEDARGDASLAGAQAQAVAEGALENMISETVKKTITEVAPTIGINDSADRTALAVEKLVALAEEPKDKTFLKSLAANVAAGSIGAAGTATWFLVQNSAAITALLSTNPQLAGLVALVRILVRLLSMVV